MRKKKLDIEPMYRGKYHGYQQWYIHDTLWVRGQWKHGNEVGYEENHERAETRFYIK